MMLAGTREVAFPIVATTLTTLVAFVSFIFLSGRLALYYVPLAVSVAIANIAALFVSFGWIPVVLNSAWAAPLVRRLPDGPNDETDAKEIHRYVEDRHDLQRKLGKRERLFVWNQRLAWLVVPPVIALLVWGNWFVYKDKVIKGGFWQLPDQEELFLYLEMPAGTDIKLVTETLRLFEEAIAPVEDGVRMRSTTFDYRGFIRCEFEKRMLKTAYPTLYRELWVELADRTGGISIFIRGFADQPYFKGPFAGSSLNSLVKITGYNSRELNHIAETTLARIQKERRVRNARITSGTRWGDRSTQDETVITFKRDQLSAYGITVGYVLGTVRRLLGVDTPWTMLIDGEQEQIQLAYADSDDIEYSDIASKTIITPTGEHVHLGELIRLEPRPIPASVVREDQRYTLFVNWEYVGTDKMRQSYIKRILGSLDLPYGYAAEEAQQQFITEEENDELNQAAVLAGVFIFLLLAALFESFSMATLITVTIPILLGGAAWITWGPGWSWDAATKLGFALAGGWALSFPLPALVILSLPMALAGVFWIFWLTDTAFDSSARIGLVLLFGVAVNNAILLVSRFRHEAALILKEKLGGDPEADRALFAGLRTNLGGSDLYMLPPSERAPLLRRAVAVATRIRLPSILLTSSTTIVGLAPLLVPMPDWMTELLGGTTTATAEAKDIWENLALSSIGGLVSSTVLLIIALPPMYYACIRVNWMCRRLAASVRSRRGRRVAAAAATAAGR
jgi:HAE1 family hydrophobic/amphiphilic exporter-1